MFGAKLVSISRPNAIETPSRGMHNEKISGGCQAITSLRGAITPVYVVEMESVECLFVKLDFLTYGSACGDEYSIEDYDVTRDGVWTHDRRVPIVFVRRAVSDPPTKIRMSAPTPRRPA